MIIYGEWETIPRIKKGEKPMSESKFNEEKQDVREMIENIKQMSDIDKAKVQGVMLGMKMAKETPGKTA
jgi:hypothetical protein